MFSPGRQTLRALVRHMKEGVEVSGIVFSECVTDGR